MPLHAANRIRLSRMIQALMDADLIRPEEGSSLLQLLESTGSSVNNGDVDAARRAAARLVRALEDLTGARALDSVGGRTAIESARRLLDEPAG